MTRKTTAPAITAEQLHESIATQVGQLRESGQWQRFLDFTRGFHAYSLNNLLLILAQRPDATMVAGFRKWQEKGRQVRRGEKGIRIFGFSQKTITETDEKTKEELARTITRFPVLSVFDIDQTEPIDASQPNPMLTSRLTGADDHGIIDALTAHLTANGWTVTREKIPGAGNGNTDATTARVVIRDGVAPEQAAKTLIHEAAHIALGHTDDMEAYQQHRGLMETEAESVAYIVAGLAGFDTAAYSIGYIAGWAQADTELIRSTAASVIAAAHALAAVLEDATPSQIQQAA